MHLIHLGVPIRVLALICGEVRLMPFVGLLLLIEGIVRCIDLKLGWGSRILHCMPLIVHVFGCPIKRSLLLALLLHLLNMSVV